MSEGTYAQLRLIAPLNGSSAVKVLRPLTFAFLMFASLFAGCARDRNGSMRRAEDATVPLSVTISNQCAVFRLSSGYIALFIVKDSPTIYYGAYFSENGTFGWMRPTAGGIVEDSGTILVQATALRLRSVGEFEAEVAVTDSDDNVTGIAVGQWGGVGDVRGDQLTYTTNRGVTLN